MARPNNPKPNRSPRRYTGGRPPKQVVAVIGEAQMRTLKALALAAGVSVEDRAAKLLQEAIEAEWQRYDAEVTEWEGEVL